MKAQDGKVYKNILTGEILGNELWLGCNDTAENYIEIEKPIIITPPETPTVDEQPEPPTVDEQIEEIQAKIDELNNSVDLLVLNSL